MNDTLPTEDERLGMAWWNTLSEAERRLVIAGRAKLPMLGQHSNEASARARTNNPEFQKLPLQTKTRATERRNCTNERRLT